MPDSLLFNVTCHPISTHALICPAFFQNNRFAMTQETILKSPTLVRAVKEAAAQGHIKEGIAFIDRDPQHFPLILSYMRLGKLLLPKDTVKLTGMNCDVYVSISECVLKCFLYCMFSLLFILSRVTH